VDQPPIVFSLQPDVRLALLAIALAMAACFVSLSLFRHAGKGRAGRRVGWIVLAGISSAFGLWAAHLVAVLAHEIDVPIAFDWQITIVSLLVAVLLTCAGLVLAARGTSWHPVAGGAIIGSGMGFMHYLGVFALFVPGVLEWDFPLVLASVGVGVGFSAAGIAAFYRFKGAPAIWGAAALLTLAFLGLHYLSMSAAHVVSDPSIAATPDVPRHWMLTAVVVGTVLVVLILGVVSMLIDRQTRNDNMEIMQQLVDTATDGVVVVKAGRIINANHRIAELCGVAPHDLVGPRVDSELLDRQIDLDACGEASLRTASGALVPVKVVHQQLSLGDEVYAIHDLTERRAVEEELQRRNKVLQEREEELRSRNLMLDTALRHMSQGLSMYDKDQRIVVCNERYATLYGLSPEDVKPGTTRRQIVERRIEKGLWGGASPEAYLSERTAYVDTASYAVQEMNDGRSIATVHVPMPGGGWVCTHEDITERRQAQAKIEHLARHDGLTDLPNRVLVRERLQETLERMRPREILAVHCLNLDRFKEVNDAIGHAIGDELLQDFAARLRHVADGIGMVARTGGDEFVIVQYPASSPADVTDLAAAVIAKMTEPFVLGEHFQVVVGTSIGIAMAPADGTEADQLLKNANLALYRAKQEERGQYRFFEKDMDARMRARHELECNLRSALANGELELYYQPLLNLKRNEISCFEALLRWRTADGKMIAPSDFVPLAEETGLIVPMGEWALRHALAEAAKWPRQIRLAVNLSPVQFNSRNLVQIVMSALAASGVEASRLELEITESLLLQDRETTLTTLHQLRDLGVRIAMDDFGTGFSSLNYLRSFPFDKLKVDRCFIAGLAEGNEESLAIVRAVAQLGASLGIATTAEGVETRAQLEVARKEGFTEVQGFWLAEPRSAAEITEAYDLHRRTTKPRRAAAEKAKTKPSAERIVEVGARPRRPRRMKPIRSAG